MTDQKDNISSVSPSTATTERDYVRDDSQESSYILDSKHIIAPKLDTYNVKLVVCGDYIQLYKYKTKRIRHKKNDNSDLNLITQENDKGIEDKKIEKRSIVRSRLKCQRIAKANMQDLRTFITLTFADNVTDIDYSNKKLKRFINSIQRVKDDFRYICVPEFQKRGAVHYHLLTNIESDSELIPKRPPKRLYNKEMDTWKELEYYDVKYWNEGFSSAEVITGDLKKVIGYISKYITKDIDDRLFSHRRYFYSRNLETPKENFLDLSDPKHLEFYHKKIQGKEVIYQNSYTNTYDNGEVSFLELL